VILNTEREPRFCHAELVAGCLENRHRRLGLTSRLNGGAFRLEHLGDHAQTQAGVSYGDGVVGFLSRTLDGAERVPGFIEHARIEKHRGKLDSETTVDSRTCDSQRTPAAQQCRSSVQIAAVASASTGGREPPDGLFR
jgi:hypothetical protein